MRFYTLAWPHAPAVLRAARFSVRDPAEADDLAQETMIKAFKAIAGFQDGTNMLSWLMTILRHTRIDHLRSASHAAKVSVEQLGAELADDSADTGSRDGTLKGNDLDELLESFSDEHVIKALQQLPEDIRWTLLLVDVEQMDHEDAAKVLGIPVGTVKSRAFRGRAMLRRTLLPLAKEFRLHE